MSDVDFDRSLAFVLKMEGGYVNDPDDSGGATNFGVTQKNYDKWRTDQGLDPLPVNLISVDEVRVIYRTQYWQKAQCDDLLWPVCLAHFDGFVQHRPRVASEVLQRATNYVAREPLRIDGMVGPMTLEAARRQDPKMLVRSLVIERLFVYSKIVERNRTQVKFLKLWRPRMQKLIKAALA